MQSATYQADLILQTYWEPDLAISGLYMYPSYERTQIQESEDPSIFSFHNQPTFDRI